MNNILKLQVDKEFERIIPPLDEDEFKNLRLNILVDALKEIKESIEIRDNIVTDIERPRNKKYIYRIWKIYNDFAPEKKLEKLF